MEKAAATADECFTVGAGDMSDIVVHSEEVVTSSEAVPPPAPPAPPTPAPVQTVYNIPTLLATTGPVMQVVTLQTVHQQAPSAQANLTNALRNVRLIAIQPRLPNGLTNGRPTPRPLQLAFTPRPETIKIQPDPNKKVAVNSFYSKLKPSPVVLAPKQQGPAPRQPLPRQPAPASRQPPPAAAAAPVPRPSPSYYREQQREREMKDFSHLNEELQRGVRILLDLTTSLQHNTVWPFKERVDPVKDGAPDYDQVITKPMWLDLIKEKLKTNQYAQLSDFVADMRLLLENCYRYNGPNHPITKKALRLEQSFEQKLALLPASLRAQCALPPDPALENERRTRSGSTDSYFSLLLYRVRHERQEREARAREKKLEELRLRREEKERQRALWADQMMNPQVKDQMRLMWEIPQIGHFLHLARGALHIGEIAQYELEHMFLMPEASVLLATLMTSLLSSPNQRVKLAESPPTPYAVWSARINSRVLEWYRTYNREGRQHMKVFETLGLEPMFWKVCGDTNPLEGGRLYHQLSFLKRVWVFKGLCDTVAHSHKTVQEAMAEEEGPESRQVSLGQDAEGFTYLHFPAVSGSDIRVYRQKNWDLDKDPIWGPIVAERRQQEEERLREEELKQAALKKARRKSTPANNRRSTAAKKTPSPTKSKQPARTPKASPAPTPQRKKADERPMRIGTRVSPRTLQRQTGVVLYKDTSSESEESDDQASAGEESEPEEEAEPEAEPEAPTPPAESPVQQQVAVAASKSAKRKRNRGSWRSSRKRRPAKKNLPKIAEEPEAEVKESEAKEDAESKPVPSPKTSASPVPMELDAPASETASKEAEEPADGPATESTVKEESAKEEDTKASVKEEPAEQDAVKTEEPEGVKQEKEEEGHQADGDSLVKKEDEDAEAKPSSNPPSQRFTVSQLMEKLAPNHKEDAEASEDAKNEETKISSDEPSDPSESKEAINEDVKSTETVQPDVPDPDRASYDPFVFELIISSVEQLQEWIDRFQDPSPEERNAKARPRCEVKLRERLQSLLEEAQPLAADQQRANQKICQQLWKEWERYRCKSSSSRGGGDQPSNNQHCPPGTDSDFTQESDGSDSGEEGSSDSSEEAGSDGLRHSKRLRKRPTNYRALNEGDTRGSSPAEEEAPPVKQGRKGAYEHDPGWDSDHAAEEVTPGGSSRRQRTFLPEMKNPDYWIGRRMTRATRAFADDALEAQDDSQNESSTQERSQQAEQTAGQSPATAAGTNAATGKSSEQLADQLRQLRRQQALLSSNDSPKRPIVASTSNGSPAVFFPTKDAQGKSTFIRITNPKAAELLSKLTHTPVPRPAGEQPAPPPRKIIIQQQQPSAQPGQQQPPPLSIDITNLVSQAVEKGMIVPHEPRSISMDTGENGHFLVTAQMTPTGPKVLSATPLPPKSNNNVVPAAAPPAAPPAAPVAAAAAAAAPAPATPAAALENDVPPPAPPAAEEPATNGTTESISTAPSSPAVAVAPARPVMPIFVTETKACNVISSEILKAVAGPDAGDAKLSIVKEGNVKVLTLILSNGEMRRLTKSQVELIQTAIRNSKISPAAPTVPTSTTAAPTTTTTPSTTAATAATADGDAS